MKQTGNSAKLTEGVTLSGIQRLFVDDTLENSITLILLMDAEGAKPYLFTGNLSGKRTEQILFT